MGEHIPGHMVCPHEDASEAERNRFVANVSRMLTSMEPKFISYKSGPVTFDSAVFQPLWRGLDKPHPLTELRDRAEAAIKKQSDKFKELGIVRRIAAMNAVRTMRAHRA
jgi:hypothetical protein